LTLISFDGMLDTTKKFNCLDSLWQVISLVLYMLQQVLISAFKCVYDKRVVQNGKIWRRWIHKSIAKAVFLIHGMSCYFSELNVCSCLMWILFILYGHLDLADGWYITLFYQYLVAIMDRNDISIHFRKQIFGLMVDSQYQYWHRYKHYVILWWVSVYCSLQYEENRHICKAESFYPFCIAASTLNYR